MAQTGFFHHIGTFLLFAACILLLITTISAPVVNDIALLKVSLTNGSTASFGTFGYCILRDNDWCTSKTVGYSPILIMESIDNNANYGSAAQNTADGLTRVQVLHPVTCGIAFIAFLFALGAGWCGSIFAAFIAAVGWIVTLVVMVTDFVAWGIVKDKVNGDGTGAHAQFSTAIWTVLVATVCLFFGAFIVLFTCCSARLHDRRSNRVSKNEYNNGGATYVDGPAVPVGRRRFWQRRGGY